MQIRTLAELATPDERTLHFAPLGLAGAGAVTAETAAEFQQRAIADCDLQPEVPDGTRNAFERLRSLHSVGIFCYDAYTVVSDLAWLVLELALRERFIAFHDGVIPLVDVGTDEVRPIAATDYNAVDEALRRGSHRRRLWKLPLSAGSHMAFRGSMGDLQRWARVEGLLDGQRNRNTDHLNVRMRNAAAHPDYSLVGPPASVGAIRDLAETINRLWGHYTPGGRLYPAPIEREVLAVAWLAGGSGAPAAHVTLRDYQVDSFSEPGDWACVVLRAVYSDRGLFDFDSRYERTDYPAELLWGPGTPAEAASWLEANNPQADTAQHLDRLFAVRAYDGRLSLARPPRVVPTLPPDRRAGTWYLLRADFPLDAFNHVRHLGSSAAGDSGPVQQLHEGDWASLTDILAEAHGATGGSPAPEARVPPPATSRVAPDVEAD